MSKRLESAAVLNKFMANYYYELDEASKTKSKKIAWCTSTGPAELLRALGFLVYFPETHSAMIGASKTAADFIPKANAIGYSPDICSYLTSDIGACLAGVTPLEKAYKTIKSPPTPDVLVYNTNQCRDVQDWFCWYGRYYDVPVIGINTYNCVTDVTESHIPSIAMQIQDLVKPLEDIAGKKLDFDFLKRVMSFSVECSNLWETILNAAATVPSPLSFFDSVTLMGAAVVGRGTEKANICYQKLVNEVNQKVKNKEGRIADEKHRIYWDGMPVWGRLRSYSELFERLKICIVASTYCNSWIFKDFDINKPFEGMAKAYTSLFIVRSEDYKEQYIKDMTKFFKADGVIYHDAKTCPNNSNCRYGMPQRIEKDAGMPFITINGDLNDLRLVSDEQTKTKIEAFAEQLEEKIGA